jgi:3-oxoacyl-[acyl-carrier-protein] synthase-3
MTQKYSRITGLGSYVPPRVVKNDDLAAMMDTSDEWIQQRTGIKQRHWVEPSVTTSDLALEASVKAIADAGLSKDQIDMILFATLSPDHEFPGTACFLQAKLGLPGIAAIDVRQQCTGFVYGMAMADSFIKNGMARNVLLVGAEVHSKGLDKTPRGRDVGVLFGDGAGAVVISAVDGAPAPNASRIYSTHLHADGSFAKELWIPAPGMGFEQRVSLSQMESFSQFPTMNGKSVFLHASKRMPEVTLEALAANGLRPQDIDLYVFHQANIRINEMVAKQLDIPAEKVFNTIDRFGNTTAATIPLGLAEARKAGRLKPGMLVASAAFGSGFTWAAAVYRW